MPDRIFDKIAFEPNCGCWPWAASWDDGKGYGKVSVDGRAEMAHRAVYEILVGPIPEGIVLDHLCRMRCCVNPEHVEEVTVQVNTLRGEAVLFERSDDVWVPPDDIDRECVVICEAMNALPGIETVSSCCGHGARTFLVAFRADSLESLPACLYWFDACHGGVNGWRVAVQTDCSMAAPTFMVEGPVGDYAGADEIARMIKRSMHKE